VDLRQVLTLLVESLLHDPATYSTYPAQWHNLLRHLSLSHTLIVLHLRSLPPTSFPNLAPIPFEEEAISHSNSTNSFPRSRVGSDAGSIMSSQVPKKERLMEIVMPEPLASKPDLESSAHGTPVERKVIRRSSISSIASAASFSLGRRRSNSTASASVVPSDVVATPMASGKADLPPVSYPSAKRYGFKRHGDPPSSMRQRTFSETSRPGSIRSMQSSTHSVALSQWVSSNRQAQFMPPAVPSNRASLTSARSGQSPVHRYGAPLRRDCPTPKAEPAFDKPLPYVQGRVPILRVFVPLSEQVQRWPSAEGAAAAIAELDKCGATRRLRLGDLIVSGRYGPQLTLRSILLSASLKPRSTCLCTFLREGICCFRSNTVTPLPVIYRPLLTDFPCRLRTIIPFWQILRSSILICDHLRSGVLRPFGWLLTGVT